MIEACMVQARYKLVIIVKMDPDNVEIKKDAERSRKKLQTLVKKQEILLRGEKLFP